MFYLIIFYLDESNLEEIKIMVDNIPYGQELLSYFTKEENQIFIAEASCKVYANDYVLETIIYPLINKMHFIQETVNQKAESKIIKKKPATVPDELNVLNRPKRITRVPPNTPLPPFEFKASEIPKSNYVVDVKIQKNLEKMHEQNQINAIRLLNAANKRLQSLSKPKLPRIKKPLKPSKPFQANKPPITRTVKVRSNLTSTLREACLYIKEQENEVKKIEHLIKGGLCKENIEKLEVERRKKEEQWHLEDIEKKHLQGQLTYEEAIIAKKRLEISNQEKIAKMKEEKVKVFEELDKWKEEEQIKIKSIVVKIQDIHKAAKEAEKKMQEDKQSNARLLQFESKQLLKQYYEEKQRELEKKMELIQEIRAMEQVRSSLNVKEFDPTESPNYGLLCEMSIAELQERLVLTNLKMKQDLQEKRCMIQQKKESHEQMIAFADEMSCLLTSLRLFIENPRPDFVLYAMFV
ncbi:unnamed protein product [Brassicogethes aeneus]|uniref:Uncharacterized protein n=1 Tax=Brassicogethes aeneus TaxID=1431903 RepID=A0A9P0FJ13_BRAAE|nr:unnamed protein product [Brassicogethes aeneus]